MANNSTFVLVSRSDWHSAFPVASLMGEAVADGLNAGCDFGPEGGDLDPWQVVSVPFRADQIEEVLGCFHRIADAARACRES